MFNSFNNTFNGFRIHENPNLVVNTGKEDWSRVRSHARARRRRKKHRQNIVPLYEPSKEFLVDQINNVIYCHPVMSRRLREALHNGAGIVQEM